MPEAQHRLPDRLLSITEAWLTFRARRHEKRRRRQASKSALRDWVEAFLWAAGVVLLINQYLFQAYQIPSPSMVPTLEIRDRIFVDKVVFGPELLPGVGKLPAFREPHRGEVFIFENPTYESRGTVFGIMQRVIYMLSLSFVNIDRDAAGNERAQFLIKRAAALGGDRIRVEAGEVKFRLAGSPDWVSESVMQQQTGLDYPVQRLANVDSAAEFDAFLTWQIRNQAGVAVTDTPPRADLEFPDRFLIDEVQTREALLLDPSDSRIRAVWAAHESGWYVPEHRIMPLGDNRDDSRDGRFFGPVALNRVLGRAMVRYWPLQRMGQIR